ncbi:TPA: hypothetical protein ACH3X1_008286 [Trebouxia sp. C0004]
MLHDVQPSSSNCPETLKRFVGTVQTPEKGSFDFTALQWTDKKPDGLKNSIVKLKNFTEAGLQRGRKAKAAPLGANTDSAESQAAPFKQPAAKRRKQTFTQQLQKLADKDRDKENLSVAGNLQADEPAIHTATPAGADKAPGPVQGIAKQRSGARLTRCGQCKTCLNKKRQARMSQKQGDQAAPTSATA